MNISEIEALEAQVENINKNNLQELVRLYKTISDANKELAVKSERLAALAKSLSYEIVPAAFEDSGVESIRVDGYLYTPCGRLHVSISEHNRESAWKWLKDNGYGDIIKPTVNHKTLTSVVNEYFEQNEVLPPSDSFNIHTQRYTQMRKG